MGDNNSAKLDGALSEGVKAHLASKTSEGWIIETNRTDVYRAIYDYRVLNPIDIGSNNVSVISTENMLVMKPPNNNENSSHLTLSVHTPGSASSAG